MQWTFLSPRAVERLTTAWKRFLRLLFCFNVSSEAFSCQQVSFCSLNSLHYYPSSSRYSLISLTCADFASTTLIFLLLLNKNTVSEHSLTKVTNSVKLSVKKWHHHHTKRFSSTLTSLFLTKIFSFISDNSAGHHLATTVSNIKPTEAWSPFTGSSPACLSVWCTSICLQCNMFEEQLTLIITTMSQWQTCFTTTRTDILIYVVSTASGSLLKVSRRPKFSSHFFPF